MVDGAVLLVDAAEGPLAQTKFVVSKAVARGLRPILVLNKVDRDAVTEQRCNEIVTEIFDLFAALGATDEQVRDARCACRQFRWALSADACHLRSSTFRRCFRRRAWAGRWTAGMRRARCCAAGRTRAWRRCWTPS